MFVRYANLYEKFNGDIHFCHISIFDPFFWGFCVEIAVVLGFCVEIHVVLAYCDYLESGKEPYDRNNKNNNFSGNETSSMS